MLYTASLNKKADHRGLLLDVTVKSARPEDRVFAPTWDLVMASKRGQITWDQYRQAYLGLLRARWDQDPGAKARLRAVALQAVAQDVTLACYCASHERCHRSVLAVLLTLVAKQQGKTLTVVLK